MPPPQKKPGSVPLPKVGERIGDYVLEQLRGQGGMGAVYAARHTQLGIRHAVKVERLRGKGARFLREAQSLARLTDPGVVRVHHYGTDPDREGLGYIVMDLVEGRDLRRELRHGPLPIERALAIGERLARTLAHLHSREVVHRDLKPANVLIRAEDGAPVLVDLGLSLHLEEDAERLTRTGQIVGTLAYMAPEQVRGEKHRVGPPSDVFALGALLYQMLTGQVPFQGDHPALVAKAIQTQDPPALGSSRRQLPRGLDALVQATLRKEPLERPTAALLAEGLASIAAGEPLPEAISGRVDRRSVTRALVAVLGVAVLLVVVAGTVVRGRARADLTEQLAWQTEVLQPTLLAAARGDPTPKDAPEAEALLAHLDALARASRWVSSGELERARAAEADAQSHLRLVALQVGGEVAIPKQVNGRSPVDITVDALALRARGHLHAALTRVEAAGPAFLPGRLLALRLLAEIDPAGFLRRAQALPPGADRTLAERLAPAACKRRTRDLLLRAPTSSGLDARARLTEALDAGRALGVDLVALSETKQTALDATAAAWETLLRSAIDADREQETLTRLASLVSQPPRVRVGPVLRGSLTRSLDRLTARHEEAVEGRNDQAVTNLRKRVFHFEHRLFYEVDPTLRETPGLRRLVDDASTMLIRDPYALLACMRYGDARGMLRLDRQLPPRALETLLRDHPHSRLRTAHKLARQLTKLERQPGVRAWEAVLSGLAGLFAPTTPGALNDITPRACCSLLSVLENMLSNGQRFLTLAQQRTLGTQLLALGNRCRESLWASFPFPGRGRGQARATVDCLELRLLAARMLGQTGLRERLYRQEVKALEARLQRLEAGAQGTGAGETEALAETLYRQAREMQPSPASLATAQRALHYWSRCHQLLNPGQRISCHVLRSTHLRALNRTDEAWKELEPHFHPWLALQSNFAQELVALAKQSNQTKRAARLFRATLGQGELQRRRLKKLLKELESN